MDICKNCGCDKDLTNDKNCPICAEVNESSLNDELLPCTYCDNRAEYFKGRDTQADAIYCTECPLGVEQDGMSYDSLKIVWNGLPRK